MLSNQVALTQYRLALLEDASELRAIGQLKASLVSSMSALQDVEPEDLTEETLLRIDEVAAKLIASLNPLRTLS